jgi:hypothetical protein
VRARHDAHPGFRVELPIHVFGDVGVRATLVAR